ncbi:hypothetical protein E2C01_076972 [Portunus trituberculatus]|uniref:Uncharacterized protein n=1 Tax=Portunus trituberculatus TaxID=210409 RepID=A0A5B7IQ24_PORTR|nr:hypothetical protein [Portunus trituberculatus]
MQAKSNNKLIKPARQANTKSVKQASNSSQEEQSVKQAAGQASQHALSVVSEWGKDWFSRPPVPASPTSG